ncbi:ROK family transcriptional regulator [Nocardioides sp. YIM 152315]|uniref:ROK family transcriptional regulator n=1 Tax=Nocardioides sp. YIM 152315 TaxID=3031760 RepID=UPI0023DA950E|nr:ROK family transcriptional regulator [Nocardioides sp. YIM 152315]MDF1605697.1 ROK family transcriptional regulator [Nocardioides sp. YIM 152315]
MRHSLAGRAETPMQARILAQLRDEGPLSKAQLADRLQVSRTTVAAEVGRLVELGLAQEAGPAASRGGRRSTLVDLASDIRFVGISIGATGMSVGLTDGRLAVLATRHEACDIRQGPEVVLAAALRLVREVLDEVGVDKPIGAGVGVPGPVDFNRGVSVSPPIMPGWDGYPVRDAVSRELGCPVVLDNDVNVLAIGEQHAGVAKGARDFLYVKIGTGIGCGIVIDGELYRGINGCAGDIGHIRVEDFGPTCACGNTGCLEAFSGGAALARDATTAARSGRSPALAALLEESGELTAADVGRAVAQGDAQAVQLIRDSGRHIGQVLAGLVSFFNPGLIVIGGRVTGLGHALLAEIRGVTYRRSLPLATGNLPIVLSELGDEGGVIGAARLISASVYAS